MKISKHIWQEIGENAGWTRFVTVKEDMRKYAKLDAYQNEDPSKIDFMVRQDIDVPLPSNVKHKINIALTKLGNYHNYIPMDDIEKIFEENECMLLQEDGTKFAGFVSPTGRCGETNERIHFDFAYKSKGKWWMANTRLWMTACRMPSGRVEVVAYVS